MMVEMSPEDYIRALELEPHPEGGFYRRVYRHTEGPENRGHASAIYYLLNQQDFALWHRFDADELWFWQAGSALLMEQGMSKTAEETFVIGPDIWNGQSLQALVPANRWQRVRCLSDWTLVSCVVSPGFLMENLELDEG